MAFLEGPEDPDVISMVDYLDKGNRIMFEYLTLWQKNGATVFSKLQQYNLISLLSHVYNLFVKMPPLPISELFGAADNFESHHMF